MSSTTTTTDLYGDLYTIRADWTQASSQIERDTGDGWEPTGRQVADFAHDSAEAMRQELRDAVRAGGDDPDDPDIADEINEATLDCTASPAWAFYDERENQHTHPEDYDFGGD